MGRATTYEVTGSIATVTLDAPENRNALSTEMLDSLGDDLERADGDPAVRAVVLTHTGTTFCAGADLSVAGRTSSRLDLAGILRLVEELDKPVVARIAGHCRGGGVGLAAVCDLSIATSGATFAFSEVRLGVAPAVISVVCLPKMRRADASQLFLTGEPFGADRAAEVGLITRAVPEGDLDEVVDQMLEHLLLGGPRALAAIKLIFSNVPFLERDQAFEWTSAQSARLFASEEATAGIAAFRERRAPPWARPVR